MGGTRSARRVSIKVFIKGQVVPKIFIVLEARIQGIYRPQPFTVFKKDFCQPACEFGGHMIAVISSERCAPRWQTAPPARRAVYPSEKLAGPGSFPAACFRAVPR